MFLSKKYHAVSTGLAALLLSSCLFAQEPAAVTIDGLVLVEDSSVDIAYLKPDADFSNYTKFMIEIADVRFKKNWERDVRRNNSRLRITDRDKEKIIKGLSDILYDTFTEELQKDDEFLVVNQPGEDVLILNVAVIDLYVTAPDVNSAGRTTSYVANAGSMVLLGELIDSTSGEVLAQFADGKAARDNHTMQISSSVFNRQEARVMFRSWAALLVEGMNELRNLEN